MAKEKFAIPKVSFLNIILNGKQKDVRTTDEPHILQYKSSTGGVPNPEASVLGISGQGGTALYASSVTDTTSVPMSVDLTLSVTTPNIFLEFFKKDILKYVRIKVLQSTSAPLTEYITNNYGAIIDLGDLSSIVATDPDADLDDLSLQDIELQDFLGETPENDPSLYNSIEVTYDSDGFKTYTFPYNLNFQVSQEKGGVNVEHLAYFAYIQIDLSKIFINEAPFSTGQGTSLAGADSILGSLTTGAATSQVVISSGQVNNYTQVFYETPVNSVGIPTSFPQLTDANGNIIGFDYSQSKIWTGPVHYHGSDNPNIIRDANNNPVGSYIGYMAGSPGADMGPYLTPVPVANGSIQDYRVLEKINGIILDYEGISSSLMNAQTMQGAIDNFKGLTTSLSEQEIMQENSLIADFTDLKAGIIKFLSDNQQNALFTEPYVARDGSGNVRFMFGMNYLEILKRNSSFPRLVDLILTEGTDADRDELFSGFKTITDFKVYRHKVHPDNPADPSVDLYEKVENEDAKLLISTSQSIYSQNIIEKKEILRIGTTVNKAIAGIREMNASTFYPTPTFQQFPALKFFTIVDGDVPNDGDYVYSVNIEFQDPIFRWIKNRLETLETILSDFETYYKAVSANPLNYNLLTNRFTEQGKQYIVDEWDSRLNGQEIEEGSPAPTYINSLIEEFMLEFVKFVDLSIEEEGFVNNLQLFLEISVFSASIASAQFGSPSGLVSIHSAMKEMYLKVLNLFSSAAKYKKPVDSQHVESQYAAGTNPRREYVIEHKFKYKLKANENYQTGYDYLSEFGNTIAEDPTLDGSQSGTSQQVSLKKIGWESYESRANKEVQKLFPNPITDAQMKIYQTPTSQGEPGNIVLNPGDGPNITKYCYFSPSVINFENIDSQNMLNDGTIRTDVKELNRIMLNILKYNAKNKENLDFPTTAGSPLLAVATGVGKGNFFEGNDTAALQSVLFGGPGGNNEEKYDLITMLGGRQSSVLVSKDLILGVENEGSLDESFGFALDELKNVDVSDNILNSNINPFRALTTIIQNNFFNVLSDPKWTWEYYIANNEDVFYNEYWLSIGNNTGYVPLKVAPNHVKALMIDLNWANKYENTNLENLKQFLKQKKPSTYEYDLPEEVPNASSFFGVLPKTQENPQRIEKNKVLYQTPEFFPFYMLNYKNIAKVEVLLGYGLDELGITNLNNPIWELLTQEKYFQLVGAQGVVASEGGLEYLCRLRYYENNKYGVKKYDILDLPVYNEYFILSIDQSAVTFYSQLANNTTGVVLGTGTTSFEDLDTPEPAGSSLIPDPEDMVEEVPIKTINMPGASSTTQLGLTGVNVPQAVLALQRARQKTPGVSTLEDRPKASQRELSEALQRAQESVGTATSMDSEPALGDLTDADSKGFIIVNMGGTTPRQKMMDDRDTSQNKMFKDQLKVAFGSMGSSRNTKSEDTDTFISGLKHDKTKTQTGGAGQDAAQQQQMKQQQSQADVNLFTNFNTSTNTYN